MAFYCATMLAMALELAQDRSGLRGHRLQVLRALRRHRRRDEHARRHGPVGRGRRLLLRPAARRRREPIPLRVRSMVGLIPLFAVEVLERRAARPAARRSASGMQWFLENRPDLAAHDRLHAAERRRPRPRCCWRSRRASGSSACCATCSTRTSSSRRTASARCRAYHDEHPYVLRLDGERATSVDYEPGESDSGLFGGNSNWRGPVWFPLNYLLIEALERYHHFYGDDLQVECPTGSGKLHEPRARSRASSSARLARLFLPDARRPRARATATTRATPTIRTGATSCCSTSTSTATTAAASARATRPAGPRWRCASSKTWRAPGPQLDADPPRAFHCLCARCQWRVRRRSISREGGARVKRPLFSLFGLAASLMVLGWEAAAGAVGDPGGVRHLLQRLHRGGLSLFRLRFGRRLRNE